MSFVFDEKNATNSLGETSWASGNKTTFKENFKASYDAMFASDRFDSERNSIEKEYSLLTDFLNKKGYSQFSNPIYNNERFERLIKKERMYLCTLQLPYY